MSRRKPDSQPLIAVTLGDPAGVGPQIAAWCALDASLREAARLLFIGPEAAFRAGLALVGGKLTLHHPTDAELPEATAAAGCVLIRPVGELAGGVAFGRPSADTGRLAGLAIEEAVRLAVAGKVAGIATCPLAKEWLQAGGYPFPGHTEMLAALTGARHPVMMFAARRQHGNNGLRVALATIHLPLAAVSSALNTPGLVELLAVLHAALRLDFGLAAPRIAVCALNPHAGESGLFGREEIEIIAPAVNEAKERGINASGPHPADSLFARLDSGGWDCVLAMYHDQGLIPVKLLDWRGAVNVTLGLPIVRTSVDHGTAFDIAHAPTADPTSLTNAVRLAAAIARHRGVA